MSEPLRKVSAKKYNQGAKVRWRVKGNSDGPVYAGTTLVQGCASCGKVNPDDASKMTTAGDYGGLSRIDGKSFSPINQGNDRS